jgi:hypothetical protein
MSSAYCGGNDYAKVIDDCKDEEFRQYVIDNVINGNIFNNMKFDKPVDEVGPVILSDYKPIGTIKDGRYDCLRGEVFTGCPTIAQFYEDYKIHKMNAVDVVNELDKVSAKIAKDAPKYANDVSAKRIHKAAMKGVRDLSRLITGGRPLSGRYLEDAKQSIRNVVSYSFMKELKKNGVSDDKMAAAVSEAMMYSDEFNKNTSYIGKKTIYDFAFTDLANDIVKKSAKSIFMGKARACLENLKTKTAEYKNKNDELIKDAAYAFVAQQLRVNGEIKDPKTNAVISPDKYVDKLIGSKKFKDSLKSAPDKFKSAKDIARSALDDKAFKEANEAANNAVNNAHNAPEVNNAAKKSVGANKTEVKTVVKK